jgi:peroxiredoxin
MSPRVQISTPAPDFCLADFRGELFQLSALRGRLNVLLVFNRGFF